MVPAHRSRPGSLVVSDAGFDPRVLADMFGLINRYTDRDLSLGGVDPSAVRRFFADWTDEIRTRPAP